MAALSVEVDALSKIWVRSKRSKGVNNAAVDKESGEKQEQQTYFVQFNPRAAQHIDGPKIHEH